MACVPAFKQVKQSEAELIIQPVFSRSASLKQLTSVS